MAPEQFRGQAVLGTDLYGLGTTLLYLKSGQDPADLPVKQMKIDFRRRVKVSDLFANWLDRLLEPIPEDRCQNATLALDYLYKKSATTSSRLKDQIAHISRHDNNLKIVIPPIWFATRSSKQTFIAILLVSLLGIFSYWLMQVAVTPEWLWIFFIFAAILTIGVTLSIKQILRLMRIFMIIYILVTVIYNIVLACFHASPDLMLPTLFVSFLCIVMAAILSVRAIWHYCKAIVCQREIEIIESSAMKESDFRGAKTKCPSRQVICTTKIAGISIFKLRVSVEDVEHVSCRKVGVLDIKGGIRLEISQARYYNNQYIQSLNGFEHIYTFGKYLDRAEQHWLTGEMLEHLEYLNHLTDRLYPLVSSSSLKL
jgi:hypothetical protein